MILAKKKSGTPVFGVFAVVAAIVLAGVGFWLYRDNAAATQAAAEAALQKPALPTGKLALLQGGLAQSRFLSLDDIDRGKDVIHATVLTVGATAAGLEGGAAMISQRKGYDCARRHVFDGQSASFDAYGKVMTTKTFSTGRHGRIAESDDMEVPAICDKVAAKGQALDGYAAAQREVQQVPDDHETWAAAHPKDPEVWARLCAAGAKGRWRDSTPSDCDRAVKLNPTSAAVGLDRAFLNLMIGKQAVAQAGLGEVLKHEPDNARALFGRGLILAMRGDKAGSKTLRGRALGLDPTAPAWIERRYGLQISDEYERP